MEFSPQETSTILNLKQVSNIQEFGRAGRDNLDADCILYYSPKDVFKLRTMLTNMEFNKGMYLKETFNHNYVLIYIF